MLPVQNVELTKVHYFEPAKHHRNVEISTISQEVFENSFNRNVIIKKNVFGHKWVLKINELDGNIKKRRSVRCFVYCLVFSCILIAIAGGVFFTFELEKRLFNITCSNNNQSISKTARSTDKILTYQLHLDENEKTNFSTTKLITGKENYTSADILRISDDSSRPSQNATTKTYCSNCTENHVCFKTGETEKPTCIEIVDRHDPTGCGGLCVLNVEFCSVLDRKNLVYECSPLRNILKCPRDTFNCGEQCIARSKVCDGINHCANMQDERFCDCDLDKNFLCTNSTKCLPKSKKCDGIVDCWDRSDEELCHAGCLSQQFSCLNGQCINQEYFCDGKIHCTDSSDEPEGCL